MERYRTWTLTLLSAALLLGAVAFQKVVDDIDRNNTLYYDTGFFSSVLAGTKKYLAGECWIEADTYLHQGLRHSAEEHEHEHEHEHGHEHGHDHDHDHEFTDDHEEFEHSHAHIKPSSPSIFVPYNREDFSGIRHATRLDDKDILPWLRLTVFMDPKQAEVYATGGHWLAWRMDNVEEALGFLGEGLANNPGAPSILTELGLIYFDANGSLGTRNMPAALGAFSQALNNDASPELTLEILTYKGRCLEELGDYSAAIDTVDRKISMMREQGLDGTQRFSTTLDYRTHLQEAEAENMD